MRILDANGRPYKDRPDPALKALNEVTGRFVEASKRIDLFILEACKRDDEIRRVIRFRQMNNLPVVMNGGAAISSSIQWDGSKYATYGQIVDGKRT